jgi:hypothetical protein
MGMGIRGSAAGLGGPNGASGLRWRWSRLRRVRKNLVEYEEGALAEREGSGDWVVSEVADGVCCFWIAW